MKKKYVIPILALVIFVLIIALAFYQNVVSNSKDDISSANNNSSNSGAKSLTDKQTETEMHNMIFEGKICDIREDEIELRVTDGKNTGFPVGEPLILMTQGIDSELYSWLSVGDNICVEFDGIVMNSYPGRIGSIYNINTTEDF